ncbi:endolytic transglycosylase MltG [Lacihabitans sp. CCS-44]|uniref:endolytic transglycosylase MltG n=1 Tax=Lacihabitans sp. CCS-44 TaxID=2487331 RepID=UPI0020CCDBE8|nr:endolytic transglycosylase MltG [Lacihabitans sp. CCS-44]MCP9754267.1 endolytic transglycosylase MltG [Lacihabitans sp. CCS-44]
MFKNKKVLAYLLVIVSSLAATMAFYFWQVAYSPNLNVDGKEKFVLYVPKNSTYESLMDTLHKHKIINDEVAFGFMTKRMALRESIKSGRYEIKPNAANKEIISKIRSGNQDPVKLTFNNVRTKEDLIKKIGTKLDFDSNLLLEKIKNERVCSKYGFTSETIMCMFLPDTYFIYWDSSVDDFLKRMNTEYKKFWNEKRLSQAQGINMTPIEVGVMASIVQSETNKPDEMPRVAGVYVNRIATNMPLQADPTVKFAVGDFSLKRILTKHLSISSPYNTYRNTGLPPGPIALPERVALDAVLDYEKHNYTYFCAKEDFSGYHNFAATYTEHLKNADIYQAALDAKGIK